MQVQDKALHRQLQGLHASIMDLKVEQQHIERGQNWEVEDRGELEPDQTRVRRENRAIVTKVEVIDNNEESPRLQPKHIKQDSGILTDDEGNSDECDELFGKPANNCARPQSARSSSFHVSSRGEAGLTNSRIKGTNTPQPAKVLACSAEVSINKPENAEATRNIHSPRQRSQTMPSGSFYRVTSMPVINEIPSQEKATKLRTNSAKAFAVYAYQKSSRTDTETSQNHHEKLPVVFHRPLQRHDSMPALSSNVNYGRARSRTELEQTLRNTARENFKKASTGTQGLLRRASSYVELSKPSSYGGKMVKDINCNESKPVRTHKLYRSVSQISLV